MRPAQDNNSEITQRAPAKRGPFVSIKIIGNKNLSILDSHESTGFQGGPKRRAGFKLALWSLYASTLDSLLVFASTCLFYVGFVYISKFMGLELTQIISKAPDLYFVLGGIFLCLSWIYTVSFRAIMGFTFGEKTCDLRLGQPHERLKNSYGLRVALRSTLIMLTGGILLPALSLIFRRDVAGTLSGLKLFSLK